MNAYYLTLPVLLPIVFGLVGFALALPVGKTRRLWFGSIICLTTVLTWVAILRCGDESVHLVRFTQHLSLTFRLDGAGRLFAGLSATLWPFTMVYAFDYMRHEQHLPMFWAFFTVAFGVTLGIALRREHAHHVPVLRASDPCHPAPCDAADDLRRLQSRH